MADPVSILIEKFLDRTLTTDTDKEDIRGDIGAVGTALEITTALQDLTLDPLQPTKISKEFMPPVIDGVFEIEDTTGVALTANRVGRDSLGFLTVGDGVTPGGKWVNPSRQIYRPNGSTVALARVELCRWTLSPDRLQSGNQLSVFTNINFTEASFGDKSVWLCLDFLAHTGSTTPGVSHSDGVLGALLKTTSSALKYMSRISMNFRLTNIDGDGLLGIGGSEVISCLAVTNGGATGSETRVFTGDPLRSTGMRMNPAQPITFVLYAVSSAVLSNFMVTGESKLLVP